LKSGGIAGLAVRIPKDATSNGITALIRRWWLLVLLIVMMMMMMMMRNKFSVGSVWMCHITHTNMTLMEADLLEALFFQEWILNIWQEATVL